jgi:ABC-type multidrug transport system fused ATPase/permease subunit
MKKIPIYVQLLLVFPLFFLMAIVIDGGTDFDFSEMIAYVVLIITVFSFGLYIVFSMENRRDRINTIKIALRDQDARLFNLYQFSQYFDPAVTIAVRNQIDQYLIAQIDWKLEDIGKSSKNLSYIFGMVRSIKAVGAEQEMIKEKMLDNLQEISILLKESAFQVKNKMSGYEWWSLLILFGVILFALFYENVGSPIAALVIAIIASTLALSLFILREYDSLQWQEQKWIWEPLVELFQDLDLVPYFPGVLFWENRVNIKKIDGLKRARIAKYKYPYPNVHDKEVEEISL